MMTLECKPNIEDADAFYAALVEKLDASQEPAALLARLVLILANQVGDQSVLNEAIELAVSISDGASK